MMLNHVLKKLRSYSDVQKGDYFPNFFTNCIRTTNCIIGAAEGNDLAYGRVTRIDPDAQCFSGPGGGYDGDFRVSGPQIKNVILLRKREGKLELLAGENIFKTLIHNDAQTSPKGTEMTKEDQIKEALEGRR